jgi:RNA polymerase-interacting CarD/CdnL/TRCF family regulator
MELEHKIIQSRSRLEDVKANLKVRDEIFNSGKSYEASLFEQLRSAQQERTQLEAEKRMLQTAAATNTEILERITATKKERDRLQNEFETVMRKPFFKKERDENSLKELDKLQALIEEKRN